jgi:hypothetical protein
MPPASFSAARALEHLRALARRAAEPRPHSDPADPLGLRAALAATGAAPLEDAPPGAALGARVRGREPGPPWLLCSPCTLPSRPHDPPWRPNAHGSGPALLLTLLECMVAAAPARDVLCVLFAGGAGPAEAGTEAETWAEALSDASAAGEPPPLQGVLAVWQVAAPGAALDLDLRSLGHPGARAIAHELFTLGRALGHTAFARGIQTAFPGLHVPFLERGLPAVPLCASTDLLAGSDDDRLEHCSAESLGGIGDTLVRFLRGERLV